MDTIPEVEKPVEMTAKEIEEYDTLLRNTLETAIRQSRLQLDALRPFFEAGQTKEIPPRLHSLGGIFARIDLTLIEIKGYLS